jgi:hypothetical protein
MSLLIENSELAKVWNPQIVDDYMRKETCIFDGVVDFDSKENNVVIPYNVDIVNKLETFYRIFVEKGGEYSLPIVTEQPLDNFNSYTDECYSYSTGSVRYDWLTYYKSHMMVHLASYYDVKLNLEEGKKIKLPQKPEDRYELIKRYLELFCLVKCQIHRHKHSYITSEIISEFHELHNSFNSYLIKVRNYNDACLDIFSKALKGYYKGRIVFFFGMTVSFEDAVDIFNYIKVADIGNNSVKEFIVCYMGSCIHSIVKNNLCKDPSEKELSLEKIKDMTICEDILKLADWLMLPRVFTEWLYLQYSKFWRKQSKWYRSRNTIIFQKRLFLYGDAVCKLLDDMGKSF